MRLAWVSSAIEGMATLSEATADTTVARARQVTTRTARCEARAAGTEIDMRSLR